MSRLDEVYISMAPWNIGCLLSAPHTTLCGIPVQVVDIACLGKPRSRTLGRQVTLQILPE